MLGPLASEDVFPCGTDMFRGWGRSKVHLPRVTRSGLKGVHSPPEESVSVPKAT